MQQITQCKYYRFGWAPIRLGPRATAPSAPPLIRHCGPFGTIREPQGHNSGKLRFYGN